MTRATIILGGNRAAGTVKCTPVGSILWSSVVSAQPGSRKSAECTPRERRQHKSKIQEKHWALEEQLAIWRKLNKTSARVAWLKSRGGDDPLTYLFLLEKTLFFFQSHGCVLGRTKDNAKCQLISWQESS